MKKGFLSLTMTSALLLGKAIPTHAANLGPADLQATSVYYSWSLQKAIVGVIEPQGVGYFLECSAPVTSTPEKISLSVLFDCNRIASTTYIADEGSVERINAVFLKNFESEFNYRQKLEKTPDFMTPAIISGVGGTLGAFAGLAAKDLLATTITNFRMSGLAAALKPGVKGAGAAGAAIAGVGLGLGMLYQYFTHDVIIEPIEVKLETRMKTLVSGQPNQEVLVLQMHQYYDSELMYSAMKYALIRSIVSANTL